MSSIAMHTSLSERAGTDARATAPAGATSAKRLWAGRFLSGFAALFLLFDSVIHVLNLGVVVDASKQLGMPVGLARGLGIVELICLALYVVPRSAVLGAILWTGYLGGAIAIQLRVGAPLLSTTLFPVYVALMLWGGLWLRDARVRQLVSARR